MPYGLLPTGFARKPLEVIDSEVEAALRAISPLITLDADDPFAQAIKVLTGKVGELWEVAEAVNASQGPDQAGGAALDALVALNGIRRESAKKSRVTATVNLNDGTDIAAGTAYASVDGNPNAVFVNVDPMVNASGAAANVPVIFEAVDTGPVVAAAGTLTQIDTALTGWNSITNAADAALGSAIESDPDLRLRREQELGEQGGGTLDRMATKLEAVAGVTAARVYENVSAVTDAWGLPPKSFEAVIDGSGYDFDQVAQVIWDNKPLGIEPFGSALGTATDKQGDAHTMRFTAAAAVTVDVQYSGIVPASGWDYSEFQAALVAAGAAMPVGEDVYASTLICAALQVDGITAVTTLEIRRDTDPYGDVVTLSRRERPVISVAGP